MRSQRLADRFVIITDAYFPADELRRPHRESICPGASAADVNKQADRHKRVERDAADPAGLARLDQWLREVCAFLHRDEAALPDVVVLLWPVAQIVQPLLFKNSREPRIVFPVDFGDLAACRPID